MDNKPIIVEQTLNAPAAKVWKAITDKDGMKKWGFDIADVRFVVGSEFRFLGGTDAKKYTHICKVTEVVANKKLAYSWRYDGYEGNSLVSFELADLGSQTRLKLTHAGVETFPASNPDFARENFVFGWTSIVGTIIKESAEG